MVFVNKSIGKTPYDISPPSRDLYIEEDLEHPLGKKEKDLMNTNILNSVNNILDSFDDEHIFVKSEEVFLEISKYFSLVMALLRYFDEKKYIEI